MNEIISLDRKGLRHFGLTTGAIILVLFAGLLPWLLDHELPIWPLDTRRHALAAGSGNSYGTAANLQDMDEVWRSSRRIQYSSTARPYVLRRTHPDGPYHAPFRERYPSPLVG
jgi:hypothetical protein